MWGSKLKCTKHSISYTTFFQYILILNYQQNVIKDKNYNLVLSLEKQDFILISMPDVNNRKQKNNLIFDSNQCQNNQQNLI